MMTVKLVYQKGIYHDLCLLDIPSLFQINCCMGQSDDWNGANENIKIKRLM